MCSLRGALGKGNSDQQHRAAERVKYFHCGVSKQWRTHPRMILRDAGQVWRSEATTPEADCRARTESGKADGGAASALYLRAAMTMRFFFALLWLALGACCLYQPKRLREYMSGLNDSPGNRQLKLRR